MARSRNWSRGSSTSTAPAAGAGRGRRGCPAPEPPPRPGYTSTPDTGSGTASSAAVTVGSLRNASRASSSVNSSSKITPQRVVCHSVGGHQRDTVGNDGRWSYLTSGSGISCADDDIGPALSAACAGLGLRSNLLMAATAGTPGSIV